jgi:NADPH:quinone reductase-like Zn-dependent oxidoreductase
VIVDMAGNRPLSDLRHALAPNGTLVIVGGSGGRWLMGFDRTIRAVLVSPFVRGQRLRAYFSKPTSHDLVALRDLLDAGKVTPVIDRTYELRDTAAALGHIAQRHTRGKTVIVVSHGSD